MIKSQYSKMSKLIFIRNISLLEMIKKRILYIDGSKTQVSVEL